jgi:hypothetical protein
MVGAKRTAVQHNPDNRSVEWFDVETRAWGSEREPGEPWQFESPEMVMTIEQPGELFARRELMIEVEVEVPGLLLSGTEARLFNARGRRYPASGKVLDVRSIVTTRCCVVLRDAFARRALSPYQTFHFDEIVPETLRVADIATALRDQRFEVGSVDLSEGRTTGGFRHFLFASRTEGPDTMSLWVFVRGHRYTTERRSRRSGGDQYKSTFETGDVRIVVRGSVHRDTRNLIHEVNELQLALRERFERLKAQR